MRESFNLNKKIERKGPLYIQLHLLWSMLQDEQNSKVEELW